jgi:hypothetical protein|mmetsp:Transcript_33277/g.43826  ORF Transcript_33277/g.43826 Transcript_33277/m.43826 type:complete len:82 (+) Transcript_33277:1376-1621(+)
MLGGLFTLRALHLEYFDGYIYAGVTPVYVPKPTQTHTVHDHPSAPSVHDHPLPMNGYADWFEPVENNEEVVRYNGHNFHFI